MLFGGLGRPFGPQKELKKPSFWKREKHGFPPRLPCFARLGPPQNREKKAPKSERKTMKKKHQKTCENDRFWAPRSFLMGVLFSHFWLLLFFSLWMPSRTDFESDFGGNLAQFGLRNPIWAPTWPQLGLRNRSQRISTASGFLAQSGKWLILQFQNNLWFSRPIGKMTYSKVPKQPPVFWPNRENDLF